MKRLFVIGIIALLCVCLIGCGSSTNTDKEAVQKKTEQEVEPEPTKDTTPTMEPEPIEEVATTKEPETPPTETPNAIEESPTPEAMDNNSFVEAVRSNIRGALGARDKINDITLEDGHLHISISLEHNDVTIKRFTGVTDIILKLTDGYDLWESITVDFGSLGYITKSKEDIDSSGASPHFTVDASDIVK